MRSLRSYVGILSVSMLASAVYAASSSVNPQGSNVRVINGLSNAQHFQSPSSGQFYVQAGSFHSAKGASRYKRQLANKFQQPVQVKKQGNYHVVVVGPMHSAAEVRVLGGEKTIVPNSPTVKSEVVRETLVEVVPSPDHFDVNGSLGIANLGTGNGVVGVTSDEINRLVQTSDNHWDAFAAQIGVGYLHYLPHAQPDSNDLHWFTSVEPQVNLYYIGNTDIKGDVWRFNNPQFNQLTFKSSINSTRLMFDTALTVVSRRQFSLYAIGGIGNAWNKMRYQDQDNEPGDSCPNVNLSLNSSTRSNFAWETGAGLMYVYNPRVAFTLQYLYSDLGSARSSASGNTGSITAPVILPPSFDLSAQTISLGLHIAV